jgi:glycosyltransferase involved in cell wall biosynthesis/SAM-dependent methyltransferase
MTKTPDVSIIIRTRNEQAWVGRTLEAIFRQRHDSFEVVIVDSGSTDRTLDIVREHPVRLVRLDPEDFTYGRALNVGIRESRGRVFASLSAHAIPLDRQWLKNITAPFDDPGVAGVAGKALPHPDCNPFDRRGLLRRFGTERSYLHHDSEITFSNANSAVRRSIWEKEPFDEELPYSEDVKWSRKMMTEGWRFVYEPTAAVYHSHNESSRQLYDRFYNESNARTQMGYDEGRFALSRLGFDVVAGTFYDLVTALVWRKSLRWTLFAPRRRFWINLGRYSGSRGIAKDPAHPTRSAVSRIALLLLKGVNQAMTRASKQLVALTHKHDAPVAPEELVPEATDRFWYEGSLIGAQSVLCVGVSRGDLIRVGKLAANVVGIESDRTSLAAARLLALWEEMPNIRLFAGDPSRLPFSDGAFERVVALDPMRTGCPELALEEWNRVTAPGGKLILLAPQGDTPWRKKFLDAGIHGELGEAVLSRGQWEAILTRSGLRIDSWSPVMLDTPLAPLVDLIGGISLGLYRRLLRWRVEAAAEHPEAGTSIRYICTKPEPV